MRSLEVCGDAAKSLFWPDRSVNAVPSKHACFPPPRSILFEGIVRRGQKGGQGLGAKVRDLTIIALVSLFSLGLAWAYEADLFAMFFAAAAAIAGVEAVRRSL